MNIQKYQPVSFYDKYQYPEKLRNDFRRLLNIAEHSDITTPSAVNTYNLLCGIEALLCRYETVSRETILAVNAIDSTEQRSEYLLNLHDNAMHQKVYTPRMIINDLCKRV